jgi:hypothetical protein
MPETTAARPTRPAADTRGTGRIGGPRTPFTTPRQLRVLGLLAVGAAALLLGFYLLPRRDAPEIVIEKLPPVIGASFLFSVTGGQGHLVALPISWDGRPDAVDAVQVYSFTPGSTGPRFITRRHISHTAGFALPDFYLDRGSLHYFNVAGSLTGTPYFAPPHRIYPPMPGPDRFLGDYLLPQGTPQTSAGEHRSLLPSRVPPTYQGGRPITFFVAPLEGDGPERSTTLDTLGYPLYFIHGQYSGDALYWVLVKPGTDYHVTSRNGFRNERAGTDELIETPLDGSPARRVATGLTTNETRGYVQVTDDGVFWRMPRPYPDGRRDLHYLRTGDPRTDGKPAVRIVQDYTSDVPPVLFHDRLYWIAPQRNEDGDPPRGLSWYDRANIQGGSLVSAALDGSDRRIVVAEGDLTGFTLRLLRKDRDRDRLYLFGEKSQSPISAKMGATPRLDRFVTAVYPERPASPLGERRLLPDDAWSEPQRASEGYLYFIQSRKSIGLGVALSDLLSAQTTRTSHPALSRIRLPD